MFLPLQSTIILGIIEASIKKENEDMRMRRKPQARPQLAACPFCIDEPALLKGHWRERFGNDHPIYLELGCGKGNFIAEHAAAHPENNYIAIDIKSEVLWDTMKNINAEFEKLQKAPENVLIMSQDIERIGMMLDETDVIDCIYINFCNPWPKDAHKKHRLTHTRQLMKYRDFLKEDGEIRFKTDDDALFEESLEYFKESGFEPVYLTYDLHNSDYVGNVQTEHEKMFASKGIKIKFTVMKKMPL